MVLLLHTGSGLAAHHPTWRDHIRAVVRSPTLDADLAAGTPPETTPHHALRASRLVRVTIRRRYADALRRILNEATTPARFGLVIPVPVNSLRVRACADTLNQLIDTLDTPGPVAAAGMAAVVQLITDGTPMAPGPFTTLAPAVTCGNRSGPASQRCDLSPTKHRTKDGQLPRTGLGRGHRTSP
jgi:hypothetical protein